MRRTRSRKATRRGEGPGGTVRFRMTTVIPYSKALIDAIAALPAPEAAHMRCAQHPSGPFLVLTTRSWVSDKAAQRLGQEFGLATWCQGQWHVERHQLRLRGVA